VFVRGVVAGREGDSRKGEKTIQSKYYLYSDWHAGYSIIPRGKEEKGTSRISCQESTERVQAGKELLIRCLTKRKNRSLRDRSCSSRRDT